MTRATRITNIDIGSRIIINSTSTFGSRMVGNQTPPYIVPEYWWKADSGLTTSAWNASAGGLNFTFTNVSSADSVNGLFLSGSGGGVTPNLSSNIDVTHMFIRFNTLLNSNVDFLSHGPSNEAPHYPGVASNFWRGVEVNASSVAVYDTRAATDPVATTAVWYDYVNGSNLVVTGNTSDTGVTATTFSGTYQPRARLYSTFPLYVGRHPVFTPPTRVPNVYVKEIALFTRSLTTTEAKSFRTEMFERWP
jgi:hypothetical protein